MFKGKISIIGDGLVGSTTAYTLMLGAVASEIVILDINRDKAEGDVLDMNHGMSFISPMTIVAGDYEQIRGSDIVIITAGANQKPGETRIALLQRNTAIFKDIIQQITKYCHDDTILWSSPILWTSSPISPTSSRIFLPIKLSVQGRCWIHPALNI